MVWTDHLTTLPRCPSTYSDHGLHQPEIRSSGCLCQHSVDAIHTPHLMSSLRILFLFPSSSSLYFNLPYLNVHLSLFTILCSGNIWENAFACGCPNPHHLCKWPQAQRILIEVNLTVSSSCGRWVHDLDLPARDTLSGSICWLNGYSELRLAEPQLLDPYRIQSQFSLARFATTPEPSIHIQPRQYLPPEITDSLSCRGSLQRAPRRCHSLRWTGGPARIWVTLDLRGQLGSRASVV